jgi:signal transduction histidine kinase
MKNGFMNSRALIGVVVISLVFIWAGTIFLVLEQKSISTDEGNNELHQLTNYLGQQVSDTARYADDYIKTIRRAYLRGHSLADVRAYMAEVPPNPDILSRVYFIDAQGKPIFASDGHQERKIKASASMRDRSSFKFQQASETDTIFLSGAQTRRNTGITTVPLARRLTDKDGTFLGVVVAEVNVEKLHGISQFARADLTTRTLIVGYDKLIKVSEGIDDSTQIGKAFGTSAMWQRLLVDQMPMYRSVAEDELGSRFWMHHTIPKYEIVISVGIPFSKIYQAYQTFQREAFILASIASLLVLAMMVLGFRELALLNAREARKAAEANNQAKTEFLSTMSHELRTPLHSIIGFGQLLEIEAGGPLTAAHKDAVSYIMKGGRHLLELIDEVLDLAKIEANELTLTMGKVSIQYICGECVSLITHQAELNAIQLVNDAGGPFSIEADHTRMKQALLNLLSNAVKYNRAGGRVTLSSSITPANVLRIAVADTGEGIPYHMQADLFKPFDRLGKERGPIEGSGIGLSITKRLVEAMGGRISFESEPGEGTTFWLDFPNASSIDEDSYEARETIIRKAQ